MKIMGLWVLILNFSSMAFALDKSCTGELGLGKAAYEDVFYQPMRMMSGPYQGECLDNKERRNVKLFSAFELQELKVYGITPKTDHVYFANFKHENKYYIAEYPKNSIANTYLVFEKFWEVGGCTPEKCRGNQALTGIVMTGHIQLRFKMKKGVYLTLYPQHESFGGIRRVNDFAYAMFAVRPLSISGQKFDPFGDGISKGYVISQNFMSTYDVALAYRDYVTKDTQVGQYLIENSHFDAEKALLELLRTANEEFYLKEPRFYNTFHLNCVTETFTGINAGAKNQSLTSRLVGGVVSAGRFIRNFKSGGREWNPLTVLRNLEGRGIIKGRALSEKMTLNQEVCFILKGHDLEKIKHLCQ